MTEPAPKTAFSVLLGALAGREFAVEPGEDNILIGSDASCTVHLDDPNISPIHARVTLGAEGARVHDTKSPQGVYVNDDRVEDDAPLRNGDILWLGAPGDAGAVMIQCRIPSPEVLAATAPAAPAEEHAEELPAEEAAPPDAAAPAEVEAPPVFFDDTDEDTAAASDVAEEEPAFFTDDEAATEVMDAPVADQTPAAEEAPAFFDEDVAAADVAEAEAAVEAPAEEPAFFDATVADSSNFTLPPAPWSAPTEEPPYADATVADVEALPAAEEEPAVVEAPEVEPVDATVVDEPVLPAEADATVMDQAPPATVAIDVAGTVDGMTATVIDEAPATGEAAEPQRFSVELPSTPLEVSASFEEDLEEPPKPDLEEPPKPASGEETVMMAPPAVAAPVTPAPAAPEPGVTVKMEAPAAPPAAPPRAPAPTPEAAARPAPPARPRSPRPPAAPRTAPVAPRTGPVAAPPAQAAAGGRNLALVGVGVVVVAAAGYFGLQALSPAPEPAAVPPPVTSPRVAAATPPPTTLASIEEELPPTEDPLGAADAPVADDVADAVQEELPVVTAPPETLAPTVTTRPVAPTPPPTTAPRVTAPPTSAPAPTQPAGLSPAELRAQQVADLVNQADAAVQARKFDVAQGLYDQALQLDAGSAAAKAGKTRASLGAEYAKKSFTAGRTVVQSADAKQSGPAGFDTSDVSIANPDYSAALDLSVSPASLIPGDRYTLTIKITNNGKKDFDIAAIEVGFDVDGQKSSQTPAPATRALRPGQSAALAEISGTWPEVQKSWQLEVVVKTTRNDTFKSRMRWR